MGRCAVRTRLLQFERADKMNKLYKYILISNRNYLLAFWLCYLTLVLFLNHVSFGYVTTINETPVIIGKVEPIYHFLMRYFNLIDGGEFSSFDKDLNRIDIVNLLYVFIYLYLITWVVFRVHNRRKYGTYF